MLVDEQENSTETMDAMVVAVVVDDSGVRLAPFVAIIVVVEDVEDTTDATMAIKVERADTETTAGREDPTIVMEPIAMATARDRVSFHPKS